MVSTDPFFDGRIYECQDGWTRTLPRMYVVRWLTYHGQFGISLLAVLPSPAA